jgi:phage I-like protein
MPTKRTKVKAGAVALAVAATFSTQSIAEAAANAPVIVVYAMPVLPAGPNTQPVDGRPTLIHDNAAIAAAFNAKGRKVPLDVGHLTEYDGAAPAVGWVRELYVAEDGSLWAWCLMTSEGEALIDGKKFGYTSPTLRVIETDAGWQVMSLKSLALTNNPALEMSATFTAEDDADDEEAEVTEQPAEPTTAAAEASESATEGAGTTEAAEAAQTPAEAQPEAPAEEGTAALTATAPAATSAPADEVVALSATVASLTAERDAVAAQVVALSAQLTALTTERDTAVQALANFKAEQTKAEVERVIAEFTAAGKCTPAEHEDLREYAAAVGVDKLKSSLSKRVPSAAFTRLSYSASGEASSPELDAQRQWLRDQGFTPAF